MADNSSTLKSYIDSAAGAAQNALGNLTGSTGDQAKGEARKEKAEAEHDLSHATAKVPGGAISGSGAFSRDDPNRTEGAYNQTMGSAKETLGGLLDNESLKASGRQQNLEGQQQEAKGQLNDFGGGLANRAQGAIGSAIAGLTGDEGGQAHYEAMRAEGKTQQRSAEHDIQKQAQAEKKA